LEGGKVDISDTLVLLKMRCRMARAPRRCKAQVARCIRIVR
jgi:hypothetical protein